MANKNILDNGADKRGSGDMSKYNYAPFKKPGDDGFVEGTYEPQLKGGRRTKSQNEAQVGGTPPNPEGNR